jgi:hypothetical protein
LIGLETIVVAGSGEARTHQPDLFEVRARATVRFADPAAWITATAVAHAISQSKDLLAASLHKIGIVAISDQGPGSTMAQVNEGASAGFSSPLRYAASNPGSLAGVACIAFGFRGPTLNLTMVPEQGVPVALQMCSSWLTQRNAQWMILATFTDNGPHTQLARAVLLGHADHSGKTGEPLTPSVAGWLFQDGN